MGDWNLLGSILEEVHVHSTIVGKIWLTILFVFRMLVLGVAAEDVWDDEQDDFICNSEQPGCRNVCYDQAFPISLIRYWVLQIIFVSSPSLVYMGHALYRLRTLEKERQKKKAQLRAGLEALELDLEDQRRLEKELRRLEEQRKVNKAPLRGSLLRTYVLHIVTRSVLEVGFMIGQYLLYGFELGALYKCSRYPCPNTVDCFVSRPTEKTVFMTFMQSIAAVSLFLNILEILHLGVRKVRQELFGRQREEPGEEALSICKSKKNSVAKFCTISDSSKPEMDPLPPNGYQIHLLSEHQEDSMGLPAYLAPAQGFKAMQTPAGQDHTSKGLGLDHSLADEHNAQLYLPCKVAERQTRAEQGFQHQRQLHCRPPAAQRREQTLRAGRNTSSSSSDQRLQHSSLGGQACPRGGEAQGNSLRPCLQDSHMAISRYGRRSHSRELVEDRSGSAESGPDQPVGRKASFLSRGLPTDPDGTDSRNESTSDSKKREESPPLTPPPSSGRRMSMASRGRQNKAKALYSLQV